MKYPGNLQIFSDRNLEKDEQWEFSRYRDFTGGENRNILPEFLKANQLKLAKNCIMTGEGVLETRYGKTPVFTTPIGSGAVTSVHRFAKESTGKKYIVVQYGTVLYHAEYDGATQLAAVSSLATGLNAAKFRSCVWKDQMILTNGVDNVKTYSGAALADLGGSPPKSKYVKVYGSRLWLVDVANPNYLRFSDLENPAVWDALNIIHLRDGDGDEITGMSPQNGGMLIFKQRSVWPLYGTSKDDFKIPEHPLSDSVGCMAPDTLIDQGFFMGASNIYRFTLSTVEEISNTHRDVIENLTLAEKQACFAVYQTEQKRVLLHVGTEILNLEERYQGITSWDTLSAQSFSVLDAKDDDGSILVGDSALGLVYKLDNSVSDDGVSIPTTIEHASIDEGVIHEKQWRYYSPEIESAGVMGSYVTLGYDVDYGGKTGTKSFTGLGTGGMIWGAGLWGTGTWGANVRHTLRYDLHHVRGNRISFRIMTSDRIKYYGYVTKWRRIGDL